MGINQNSVLPDGGKVRRIRIANGDTQESLAQKAGYAKSTIERVEKGKPALITTLNVIAKALKVDVSGLLAEENDKHELILKTDTINYLQPIEQGIADNWFNLYRKNLIEDLSLPLYHIPLKCSQINFPQDDFDDTRDIPKLSYWGYGQLKTKKFFGNPLPPNEIIKQHKNILLTGDSGTGKTTELRFLANYYLSQNMEYIPFYIELEDFVPFLFESLNKFHRINLPELFGRSVATLFFKKNSYSKLIDSLGLSSFKQYQDMLSEDLFNRLAYQLSNWFETKGISDQKVLLLIDDLNKINPFVRNELINQLDSLFQEPCKVVVTCRSNIAKMILKKLCAEVKQYELQEVSDEQILSYLKRETSGNRQRIFESNIENDPLLHSMAKTPFFLYLLAKAVNSNQSIASLNRAELVRNFINERIENWHPEKALSHTNAQKDLIWTILPTVSKWTIDVSTLEKQITLKPFYLSKEFKSIKESSIDIFKVLEIGEACGLLKTSGLQTESGCNAGYPVFIHDYVRDYFAAQYFYGHDSHQLLKRIKKTLEYYAWDEALLQFLELNSDVDIFKNVVEYVLSHDPLFAALCVKSSKVADDQFCINLGNKLYADHIFDNILEFDRKMYSRSFGRHPLTDIWEKASFSALLKFVKTSESDFGHWLALGSNATDESIPILQDIKKRLPCEATNRGFWVLLALTKISTRAGFKAATEMYKELCNLPKFKDLWFFLFDISYSPTLSELYGTFPHDKYPIELNCLLDKVRDITNDELPLLNSLIFPPKKNEPTSMEACKLLARSSISNAVDILFHCYESFFSNKFLFDIEKKGIVKILLQKSPQRTIKLLIQEVKGENGYLNKYDYWKMIVSTKEYEAIEHVINYAYEGKLPSSVLCMDFLCSWPQKEAIACFKSIFNTEELLTDRAKLLGAIIGDEEYSQKAYSIFEDIYSILICSQIPSMPELSECYKRVFASLNSCTQDMLKYSKKTWREFNHSRAVHLLPLSIRAISKKHNIDVFQKLQHIIEWSYPYVVGRKKFQWSHEYKYIFWDIFSCGLLAFSECHDPDVLSTFTESLINKNIFTEIFKATTKFSVLRKPEHDSFNDIEEKLNENIMLSRLVSALGQFIQNMPSKHVLHVMERIKDIYLKALETPPKQIEQFDYGYLSEIVVNAIKRVDDESICDYLKLLDKLKNHSKEKERIAQSLINKIKSTTGKRYLPLV